MSYNSKVHELNQESSNHAAQLMKGYDYANSTLLKASQQAGFLSAAAIASIPFWSINNTNQTFIYAIFILFVFSIFMSVLTHILLGASYIHKLNKITKGDRIVASYIVGPIITGCIQMLSLIIGIGLLFYAIYQIL